MQATKLGFQKQQQDIHVRGAVDQAKQLGPIQTQNAINTATGLAPIETGKAAATAKAVGPISTQTHTDQLREGQKIKDDAEAKPSPSWLPHITKSIEEIDNQLSPYNATPISDAEKQDLMTKRSGWVSMRESIMNKGAEKMGIAAPTPAAPAAPAAAPAAPSKPVKPGAQDLVDYRVRMKQAKTNGNAAAIKALESRAMQHWGYVPK
jgi:hypothetical protein